ncbi:MAG: hypothetical protein NZ929_04430 [Aigarchaeota archaeon]|nr:hypothetical protein [Aigarchaeota archaeon]MCX8192733.1 hypothetical protein [Nitrososphaeria archaeon]MDW7985985.1 hypothetical protein [Nitrososphaerota archaeon]
MSFLMIKKDIFIIQLDVWFVVLMDFEKTVTRSFRISEIALKILQEDARRYKVSVNTLVNQVLLSYVNFDRYAEKLGVIKLMTSAFKHLLDAIPEELLIKASYTAGKDTSETFIIAKEGTLSLEAVIDYLKTLAEYANFFEYSEVVKEDEVIITLTHPLGLKGSLFIAHYIQPIFERIRIDAYYSLSDHAVVIELKKQ